MLNCCNHAYIIYDDLWNNHNAYSNFTYFSGTCFGNLLKDGFSETVSYIYYNGTRSQLHYFF